MIVVFKMRDSVPSARYPPVCNVLRLYGESGSSLLIVYRLHDYANCIHLDANTIMASQLIRGSAMLQWTYFVRGYVYCQKVIADVGEVLSLKQEPEKLP